MIIRWWVVANPKRWSFDKLFETGSIQFTIGNIEKHFGHLKAGDIVVGYESSPRRRLTALATVVKPYGMHQEQAQPCFELAPLLPLPKGLTYEQMRSDAVISKSQPMRCHNQGTLFTLQEEESGHLLQLLAAADPAVEALLSKA